MLVNYWNCKFADCDDYWSEDEGRVYIYMCTHPNSKTKHCNLDNKWCNQKDDCKLLDKEK